MMRLSKWLVTAIVWCSYGGYASAAELNFACGAVGQELELCKSAAQAWEAKTGHTVKVYAVSANASDRLGTYQQMLRSKSDFFDVIQIDVVWAGLLGDHLLDLKSYTKGIEKTHFAPIVANNTIKDQLVAMPWTVDAGVLYYRTDLLDKYKLPVPRTWDELGVSAKKVMDGERQAGKTGFWGYVWQGDEYEGLTCNAIEWVASYGGGGIIEPNGRVSINNPRAVAALKMASSWVGKISPKATLRSKEEDARKVFQDGNAVFMRNWPYAWSLAHGENSVIKGKVGVAPLPKGPDGPPAAALGGQQLAVPKYSQQPKLAADLLLFLTSPEVQKERALKGSLNPTIVSLYKDPDLVKASPLIGSLYDVFTHSVARPSVGAGTQYGEVSSAFYLAVYDVISGRNSAEDGLRQLDGTLSRIKRSQ